MIKRFIAFAFILVLFLAAVGGYFLYSAHQAAIVARQNQKAPDAQITIPEGWSNKQIADYLQGKQLVAAKDFLAAQKSFDVSAYPILSSKPKTADLEGFLFPDTYRVAASSTDEANGIIKKMLDNFSAKFTADMEQQAKTQKSNVFQTLVLASIIEKEADGNLTDRKTIAGIFDNRLKADMPLQSDATVSYITGKNSAQASLEDTQIDSPYNTYKYAGLPPGPICNPSLDSIEAALNPTPNDYFYFLTDPKTGRAVFAKTYDEHLKNKAKYLP